MRTFKDDGAGGPRRMAWSRLNQWLLWLGLAAAVAWLYFRHGEHLLSLAPLLFVLACPFMHLFGHGGRGRHGRPHQGADPRTGFRSAATRTAERAGAAGLDHAEGAWTTRSNRPTACGCW